MDGVDSCEICGGEAKQLHAENYYDLSTWVDLCAGCHQALHKRFKNPHLWFNRLRTHAVTEHHWSRCIAPRHFDLADYVRSKGITEMTPSSLVAQPRSSGRRPRQAYLKMEIPEGTRIFHPRLPQGEVVLISGEHTLKWRGSTTHSMTSVASALQAELGLWISPDQWNVGDRTISERYDKWTESLGWPPMR